MGTVNFRRVRPVGASLLLLAAGGLLTACDILSPREQVVRLEIEASDGSQVQLITTFDFSVGINQDGHEVFILRDADTTWVDTPYAEDYTIEETASGIGGFYGRAAASENPDAVVTMRAAVNGDQAYQDSKMLTGEGLQFYYRVY
jgi:hypothetical protein